jgi:hypothetical protein
MFYLLLPAIVSRPPKHVGVQIVLYTYVCVCACVCIYTGWRKKNACFLKWVVSACEFFLWCYLKSKIYVRKSRTVDDLKFSIREEIATVPQEILVKCDAEL